MVTPTMRAGVVIVGAGHAGVQVAVSLANTDNPPSIMLIGDEPVLPYERPPLTKRLLYADPGAGPVLLRSAEYWNKSAVALHTGLRVIAVEPDQKVVRTDRGDSVGYDTLVWATGGGAMACGLPGEQLGGVHTIRAFADLTLLRDDLARAQTAVVIGGGYLGLEAASGLRQLGIAVTVVEAAPRLLARVTGTVVSDFFTALHRRNGTTVRLGESVEQIVGGAGRAVAVRLGDGTSIPADVVIVGVGMRPNVGPLIEAGATGSVAGVDVDVDCRTSLGDVYAIGDCARQLNSWSTSGEFIRVESVHNAAVQAAAVLRAMGGLRPLDPPPPRFWSTQYGEELKTVGLASPTDDAVVRGDPARADFSVIYLRDGRMAAIDTVNRPRDFARAQPLIGGRWRPSDRDALVDPSQDLPRLSPVPGTVEVGA